MALDAAPRLGWLDRLLGEGGYEALARSRWRTFTVPTFLVGVVSDVMQVFGPFAYYLCLVALVIAVVLWLSLLLRLPFRRQCIEPCAIALIAVVVFAAVLGLQRLNAAENRGTLATAVPAVVDLQEALRPLMERLGVVEEKLDAVKDDTSKLLEGQDEIRTLIQTLVAERGGDPAQAASLAAEVARLESKLDLTERAVAGFLRDVGETPLELDNLLPQLETFAERYHKLLAKLAQARGLPEELEEERARAPAAVLEGKLAEADAILADLAGRIAEWRREQQARLNDAARTEAAILAERAQIARTRLLYRESATLLAEAADLTSFDPETSWRYRLAQAADLYDQGNEFGDNATLAEAIATYKQALALTPRDARPDDWAGTQNDLGNALQTFGRRESGTATLKRAVQAYEAALLVFTREHVPLEWAMTQNNLGATFFALGSRESGTATLERAVQAFEAALLERNRERVPLEWAATQNNLGAALLTLGSRESGNATLERGVQALEAALLERTRERVPQDWAMTQNNPGNALQTLGSRESGTATLERAVQALEAALLERTRERVPLDLAMTSTTSAIRFGSLAAARAAPQL